MMMNANHSEEAVTSVAKVLQNWFVAARPSSHEALSQVDEARARGAITREEYLALLDDWPASDDGEAPEHG